MKRKTRLLVLTVALLVGGFVTVKLLFAPTSLAPCPGNIPTCAACQIAPAGPGAAVASGTITCMPYRYVKAWVVSNATDVGVAVPTLGVPFADPVGVDASPPASLKLCSSSFLFWCLRYDLVPLAFVP